MSDLQMLEALNRAIKREAELAALKARLNGLMRYEWIRAADLHAILKESNDERQDRRTGVSRHGDGQRSNATVEPSRR